MKHWLVPLIMAVCVFFPLAAQEDLRSMRLQLWEHSQSLEQRICLWEKLKARLYPLTDNITSVRLENNMNVLACALNFLLERSILIKDTVYLAQIATLAQEHYNFSRNYFKKNKKVSPSLKYAYAQLMMLITPLINRIDRSSAFFHPVNYFTQYDEIERIKDIAIQLLRQDPHNPDYHLLYAQYSTLLTNHTTMTHACIARCSFRKAIKAYQEQERKADLAWAYLWESSLYMRRCLKDLAEDSLEKAQALFPNSFLVQSAKKRMQEELPWM